MFWFIAGVLICAALVIAIIRAVQRYLPDPIGLIMYVAALVIALYLIGHRVGLF